MQRPKLILKADDYGDMAEGNDAINELVAKGLLTSVGVIVTFAQEQHAQKLLGAIRQSPDASMISVVLHTNFQTGRPLSAPEDVPSLVDSRGFFKRPLPDKSSWVAYARQLDANDVKTELHAQIDRFTDLFNRAPDALDSHNVILAVPPVDKIAMEIAQKLHIALTYPYLYAAKYDGVLAAQVLDKELLREYKERHIRTVDHAYPRYFNSYSDPVRRLIDALNNLQPGVTQIVFHPVHPDYDSIATDTLERYSRRLMDYKMLTNPRVEAVIKQLRSRGQLASFKTLP